MPHIGEVCRLQHCFEKLKNAVSTRKGADSVFSVLGRCAVQNLNGNFILGKIFGVINFITKRFQRLSAGTVFIQKNPGYRGFVCRDFFAKILCEVLRQTALSIGDNGNVSVFITALHKMHGSAAFITSSDVY